MASDGAYVRWVNSKEPGSLMFVTTTVLGFVPFFRSDARKASVLRLLCEACRHHRATLHAFCVMEHHIHLVIRAPEGTAISRFMQSFKRHSAVALLGSSTPFERRYLNEAAKDGRSFWMRSFRGVPIRSERVFWACIRYLHLNPVRAGLCERTTDYPFSSAMLFEEVKWSEESGVLAWMD